MTNNIILAIIVATMHLERVKSKQGGRVYEQILLRESYREPGGGRSAVKKRTLLNLTKQPPQVVAAIELALKHKDDLGQLGSLDDVSLDQGPSVGAVFVLAQLAARLGLDKALGKDRAGKLALWQVLARVLDQGSRLSAVRLAKSQAVEEILGLEGGFDEDDLYQNLDWLASRQEAVEDRLFRERHKESAPDLFLYDVTSSYLEGEKNELADWGYNRDKKRGKMQIVVGLLCDKEGAPVTCEVFEGNTPDLSTFRSQVDKAKSRFGCKSVTFVGDRGMIKSDQIEDLAEAGYHYITAITKRQIRALIKKDVFQLGLFDENLCEVEHGGVRYILRRNPVRADEIASTRASKLSTIRALAEKQNEYLAAHPKAETFRAWREVSERIARLGLSDFVLPHVEGRRVVVEVDEEYLRELSELDGCYALKTDLPAKKATKEIIHARYKDLGLVEQAFRTMKTGLLEVRPVFVRNAARTRAHVLVVMLAYLLVRELREAWANLEGTVEEGLDRLQRLCAVELKLKGRASCLRVPNPDLQTRALLKALDVGIPPVLPKAAQDVASKKIRRMRPK